MIFLSKKKYIFIAIIIVVAIVALLVIAYGLKLGVMVNPVTTFSDKSGSQPNILLIITDDMGLDADPCHTNIGAEKPNMPNLLALCEKGVTFDNVWGTPVCSPTRANMMSGQYGFRTGVTAVDKILSPNVESVADVLTNKVPVPYANAFIGKWHMSGPNPEANIPSAFGVQYFAGFLADIIHNYFDYDIYEQGVKTHQETYATTLFANKAIEWIQGQGQKDPNRPWFMWLAFNAPHKPFHLPPKDLISDKFLSGSQDDIDKNPRKYYFAALEAVDKEMGRLFSSITPQQLSNTIVIFIGDNGTPSEVIQAPFDSNRAKTSVYQGGVGGVLTVAGKGVTREGAHEKALINATDIFATISDLAGSTQTKIYDSVSFKQSLTLSNYNGRTFLYTEWEPAKGPKSDVWAVRDNTYKLMEYSDGTKELYDLSKDPYENTNLITSTMSTSLQEVVNKLQGYKEGL